MAQRATFGLAQASRRWWIMLLVLVGASVYVYRARDRATPAAAQFGGPAQGTTYSVVLGGARAPAVVTALQKSVDSLLADIDATMSTYDSTSEVSRFNRFASTSPIPISSSLAEVLRVASEVSRASGGAFDVTIAPLVEAWGFGVGLATGRVPNDSVLVALRQRVGWQKLRLEHDSLSKRERMNPGVLGTALAMDKIRTKQVWLALGAIAHVDEPAPPGSRGLARRRVEDGRASDPCRLVRDAELVLAHAERRIGGPVFPRELHRDPLAARIAVLGEVIGVDLVGAAILRIGRERCEQLSGVYSFHAHGIATRNNATMPTASTMIVIHIEMRNFTPLSAGSGSVSAGSSCARPSRSCASRVPSGDRSSAPDRRRPCYREA